MIKSSKSKTKKPEVKTKDDSAVDVDSGIRPSKLDEIIGRVGEKKTIKMVIDSAKTRGESVDHILFYGPPGLGKTTFAMAIANEINASLHVTSGPVIQRAGDLAAMLTNLRPKDVLFIDEIHRLSRTVEEILYPAMEDRALDIVMGKGPSAKSIRLNLEPFTLIGATTQIGKISSPMRDRFGLVMRLEYFDVDELVLIIMRAAEKWSLVIDVEAAVEIAKRSRGTGRVALRLFRRIRDFFVTDQGGRSDKIDVSLTVKALDLLGIDEMGLEEIDRNILDVMFRHYGGGPVGLSTLAAAVSEDISTLSDVYEPFLMKCGLIKRTARGRVLTESGINYVVKNLG